MVIVYWKQSKYIFKTKFIGISIMYFNENILFLAYITSFYYKFVLVIALDSNRLLEKFRKPFIYNRHNFFSLETFFPRKWPQNMVCVQQTRISLDTMLPAVVTKENGWMHFSQIAYFYSVFHDFFPLNRHSTVHNSCLQSLQNCWSNKF